VPRERNALPRCHPVRCSPPRAPSSPSSYRGKRPPLAPARPSWYLRAPDLIHATNPLPCPSNFFFAHYNHVKTLAPNFAFQIRHTDVEPYMLVEYDFGETAKVALEGLKEGDIVRKVRGGLLRPVACAAAPPAAAAHAHTAPTTTPAPTRPRSWSRRLRLARRCPARMGRAGSLPRRLTFSRRL
jgi:hypothetical protein